MRETRKIFDDPDLRISATCVRVPTFRAHAVSVSFECEHSITPGLTHELIAQAPGVRLVDDREHNLFPMPCDASGQDDILIGRIRQELSDPSGRTVALFAAGDQLLKGAALNAVQIEERLLSPKTTFAGGTDNRAGPGKSDRVLRCIPRLIGEYEMTTRRRFTAEFKARVALEALRGDKTVQEIASRHQVHPNQVSTWKRQAMDGLSAVFSNGAEQAQQDREAEIRDLHAKIGQLTVERDLYERFDVKHAHVSRFG